MTTTSEAFEVLSHVALAHPRTAPRVDDLEAAYGTATIWAELFSRHNLSKAELIAAVDKRAESEHVAPEAAEIIKVAREIRRDRAERETREDLEARQAQRDSRAIAGRYQPHDAAGWQYGCPTYDTSEEEREGHRTELEARVAQLRAQRPELTAAQAEQTIRDRDRAYAEKLLANIGRHDVAAYVGGFVGRSVPAGDR
jgi:hypothetical protein